MKARRSWGRWVVGGLGAAALSVHLVSVVPHVRSALGVVSAQRYLTPHERMTLVWGELYRLALLIREVTPPSGTVLIPSPSAELDAVWVDVGNDHVVRSLLYPRRITRVSDAEWQRRAARPPERNVYVVVVSRDVGGRTYVWPPPEVIAGWRLESLPSGWGVALSPESSR